MKLIFLDHRGSESSPAARAVWFAQPDGSLKQIGRNQQMADHISQLQFRWLIRRDMEDVLRIEQLSDGTPWTEAEFLDQLRKSNSIGLVVEQDEEIMGFILYELHRSHIEVVKLTVSPKYRHNGIGSAMVHRLIDKLSLQRRFRIVADVDEYNLEFCQFLKVNGFMATAVSHGFINMVYELPAEQQSEATKLTNRIAHLM